MKTKLTFFCCVTAAMCLLTGCTSDGGSSKGVFKGVEECSSVYYENNIETEYGSRPADNAMDLYKQKVQDFLTEKIGVAIPTYATETSGIVVESQFTVAQAEGYVGRSNGTPFVTMTAKASNTGKEVGYIGRDGNGIPVFAGTISPKGGELSVAVRFDLLHDPLNTKLVHKTLGSVASIELMSYEELDNHIISCSSYYFTGVAKIELGGKTAKIPESLPDLYNNRELTSYVEEGPEEDFTINRMILRQDDRQFAVVTYGEPDYIYDIRITSPEAFVLYKYYDANHSRAAQLVISCATEPLIVMNNSDFRQRVMNDPETEVEIPAFKKGKARYYGFKVEGWKEYGNKEFYKKDIIPGSHFTTVILRENY